MSNNDIFRKELEELETSLVFPDASWDWSYDNDYEWYYITLHLTGGENVVADSCRQMHS